MRNIGKDVGSDDEQLVKDNNEHFGVAHVSALYMIKFHPFYK